MTSSRSGSLTISMTQEMYSALAAALARRTDVSPDLRRSLEGAVPLGQDRPWPETHYVITCSETAAAELRSHVERALRRAHGARRGTLSRALLRITDATAGPARAREIR